MCIKDFAAILFFVSGGLLSFSVAQVATHTGQEQQVRTFKLELPADYHQFHLHNGENVSEDLGNAWTQEAFLRMLAVTRTTVAVGTATAIEVPVEVVVLNAPPDESPDLWDHVTEASLDVSTGTLVVAGCVDQLSDSLHIPITPGTYRVRVSIGGLSTVKDEFDGKDYYKIVLWPAPMGPVAVLKNSGFHKIVGTPVTTTRVLLEKIKSLFFRR
jgi:hypothetical protein